MKKEKNNQIIRVAIYCRVSTEEQVMHGYSMQAQEEALIQYAQDNNMKIIGIYRDEGFSARKPIFKRKIMLELLEDVKERKIDRILFIKLDRWFRSLSEYYKCQSILDENNVTWQAILEDYNTATSDGRLKVNIMLSVAEAEADKTSERIKFVFDSKIMRKEAYFPNRCAPIGYKVDEIDGVKRLVKDEKTRQFVEFFFRRAQESSIRRAGVEANIKFNIDRCYSQYYRMVKNDMYTGSVRGIQEYCEPYITTEELAIIRNKNNIVRKAKNNRVYIFSGLIICSECGRRMEARYVIKNRREYVYYRCHSKTVGSCDQKDISELRVEKYLLENVREDLGKSILEYDVYEEDKRKNRKSDIDKMRERLRRLNVSYQAGAMDDNEYLKNAKEIKDKIEILQAEQNEDKTTDVTTIKEFLSTDFESIYKTLSKEEQQRFWRSIIKEIHLKGNEISEIKYRI